MLFISTISPAQEGFPLDGTWRGQWTDQAGKSTLVVMILKWDGEKINGIINPGRNPFVFNSASLDPGTWTVNIAATNTEGIPVAVTGVLKNIGSYHRSIDGSWSQAGNEYAFTLRRE